MSVVGIDPSLRAAGIAILGLSGTGTAEIRSLVSVGRTATKGDGWRQRSNRIVAQTRRIVSWVPADAELVLIEAMPQGMTRPLPSFGDRWGLWWGVYSTLSAQYPVAVVNPSTRAVWPDGKYPAGLSARQKKAHLLGVVRAQWPADAHRIHDDNEADGLTLAEMGAHWLGWPLPFETTDRHDRGLGAVEWPEGLA
ncbi:crossover junction endodeoxyribonuclease RuvC [Gordonia terrae]|uniref:crossover junction endodeoxyribonuclease RuvC n=1 Tax=Gordonia terrae TaxID=2055 RepID=UPI003F6BA1EE